MSVTTLLKKRTDMTTTARPSTATRRGHTLIELLVALPIAALLGTLAIAQFLNINTLARHLNSSSQIARGTTTSRRSTHRRTPSSLRRRPHHVE